MGVNIMIKIKIGNIFESDAKTLVNTVNCVGVMGKGIALEFKKRYPNMFEEYKMLCDSKKVIPGKPYLYNDILGNSIINFPTKDHWRSPSHLDYIISGLDWFRENYKKYKIDSIAFPPLGCGNGGLDWDIVGPVMYYKLKDIPIYIEIYAPYGTKREKLSPKYLSSKFTPAMLGKNKIGVMTKYFNENWYLFLEVIKMINGSEYTLKVGRTMFQKLCYILTRGGIETNLVFRKNNLGPYCEKVEDIIKIFANSNLLTEETLGRMVRLNVNDSFNLDMNKYSAFDRHVVNKTVDLFRRVEDTEHVEIIASIIYSYDELKRKSTYVSEDDIFKYVLNWNKSRWIKKKNRISNTIRDLTLLKWIAPEYSKDLPGVIEYF